MTATVDTAQGPEVIPAGKRKKALRLLIVEDTASDAALVALQLRRAKYDLTYKRVWTLKALRTEIERGEWDFLVTDYTLEGFNALDVLGMLRQLGSAIPAIIVSGTISEEMAVKAMVAGARDYVMKDNLPRLAPAIERELAEADSRRLRRQAEQDLRYGEERLSAILENSVEGIFVIAPDGLVEYANRSMLELLGDKRSDLLGASAIDLARTRFHNVGSDPLDLSKYALQGAGLRAQGEEVRLRRADASEVPVTFSAAPIWMSDGSFRGTVVTVTDISELQRQADELRRSIDSLRQVDAERRQLVRHLVKAGEDERQRIAEDLHDDTIQAITVVGLRLGLLRRRFPVLDGDEQYQRLEQAVTDAVARCRSMLFDLHPRALDTEGIGAALTGYLKNFAGAGGPLCELEDELVIEPDSAARVILFRITQEALVNVRKHARAGHARVKLWNQDHGFACSVSDDGVGFEPGGSDSGHGQLGLTTMQERASQARGWLRVESIPGKGTDIQFWIPESSDVDTA